jgi:hypothetical protein
LGRADGWGQPSLPKVVKSQKPFRVWYQLIAARQVVFEELK